MVKQSQCGIDSTPNGLDFNALCHIPVINLGDLVSVELRYLKEVVQ